MELIKLKEKPEEWDQRIRGFWSKTLFHESCWHEHITKIHKNSKVDYFSINRNGIVIGYFCGLVVRKGFIKIMGSPLRGTGTNYMGPVVNQSVDPIELLSAIRLMCKKEKIAHIELNNDFFRDEHMAQQGYDKHFSVTHKVTLPATKEDAFKNLKSTCRNRIRKAERNRLRIEATDEETIVNHFNAQFKEVYGKQGLDVPFGIERMRSLYYCLYPKKRLLPLWVKKDETVIATGLFPYDENAVYFWGATSWVKYHKYCPNEILHWKVIRFAIQKKIPVYNMCGGKSQFKNKFGGEDVDHITFSKSFLPFLRQMRILYKKNHYLKLKWKGKLKRIYKN